MIIDYLLLVTFVVGYVVCLIMSHKTYYFGFWTQVAIHSIGMSVSIGIIYLLIVFTGVA